MVSIEEEILMSDEETLFTDYEEQVWLMYGEGNY